MTLIDNEKIAGTVPGCPNYVSYKVEDSSSEYVPVYETYLDTLERLGDGGERVVQVCSDILAQFARMPGEGYMVRRTLMDTSGHRRSWLSPKTIITRSLTVDYSDGPIVERAYKELKDQKIIISEHDVGHHSSVTSTERLNLEAILSSTELYYLSPELRGKLRQDIKSGAYIPPTDVRSKAKPEMSPASFNLAKLEAEQDREQSQKTPAKKATPPLIVDPAEEEREEGLFYIPLPEKVSLLAPGDVDSDINRYRNSTAIGRAILKYSGPELQASSSEMIHNNVAELVGEKDIEKVEQVISSLTKVGLLKLRVNRNTSGSSLKLSPALIKMIQLLDEKKKIAAI